jgi:membrane-associated protease RseP (regulator of RpoE activity)
VILQVDEERLNDLNHFIKVVDQKKGEEVKLMVERERDNPCLEKVLGGGPVGEEPKPAFSCEEGKLILWATPRETPPEGQGPLGVVVSDMEMKKYPFWQMPIRGTIEGFRQAFGWTAVVVGALGKMVVDLITQGVAPKDIAGPVGIFQITGMVARGGILSVFQFIGILSVNLAVINILPFPALDGGRLIFVAYEAVRGRRPKPSFERWVNTAGMATLIFLIILVTINDIKRLLESSGILGEIRKILPF